MDKLAAVTIVNVGYRSTNYWVVTAGTSRLLVDIGWPGTLGSMKANLKRMGIPLREIRYAIATHYLDGRNVNNGMSPTALSVEPERAEPPAPGTGLCGRYARWYCRRTRFVSGLTRPCPIRQGRPRCAPRLRVFAVLLFPPPL